MAAQPQIQGIHEAVELSSQSQIMQPLNKPEDLECDEADLIEAQEHQTESIKGSQVAFALNRLAQQETESKKKEKMRVVAITILSVLALAGVYMALVLLM